MRSLFFYFALCLPAAAQEPMNETQFGAYVQGKTLGYSRVPGIERYLPGKRVIWTTISGRCTTGVWFESKDNICFRYDDRTS